MSNASTLAAKCVTELGRRRDTATLLEKTVPFVLAHLPVRKNAVAIEAVGARVVMDCNAHGSLASIHALVLCVQGRLKMEDQLGFEVRPGRISQALGVQPFQWHIIILIRK